MENTTVTYRTDSTPNAPDSLAAAIAAQRDRVVALDLLVSEARDNVMRAGAELDVAVRARNRAIFQLQHLDERLEELVVPAK